MKKFLIGLPVMILILAAIVGLFILCMNYVGLATTIANVLFFSVIGLVLLALILGGTYAIGEKIYNKFKK